MNLQLPILGRTGGPAVALALAAAVAVAACGGAGSSGDGVVSLASPSGSPGGTAAPTAPIDPEEAMLAFQACMKEHGVDIQVAVVTGDAGGPAGSVQVGGPDEGSGVQPAQPVGDQFDPKTMEEADKACRHLLPASGMGDPAATMDPALADQLLKFAQCMRDQGVDFPDPQFSGGGVSIQVGAGDELGAIDPSSKVFQDAQEACAKELPGGAPVVMGATGSGATGPAVEVKP